MGNMGVVIVAAGRGSRMKTTVSKQYLMLADKPVIVHTLLQFEQVPDVSEIVIVTGADDVDRMQGLAEQYSCSKVRRVVCGGRERQQSVYNGLRTLGESIEWVLVHDGVRPFISQSVIRKVYDAARLSDAAVVAVPVKDTIKIVGESGVINQTPNRSSLWAVQTPQAFRLSLLLAAYKKAEEEGFLGTDDSMLVERMGHPVRIVEGEHTNIKITTPEDLEWAAYRLGTQKGREE